MLIPPLGGKKKISSLLNSSCHFYPLLDQRGYYNSRCYKWLHSVFPAKN